MADTPNQSSENSSQENPPDSKPVARTPPAAPVPTPAPRAVSATVKKQAAPLDPAHVPMTEEFDRAKWTLPPIGIVFIGIGIVAVVAAILAFTERAKPSVTGAIDNINVVALPDNTSLVSVQLHLSNATAKGWYIQSIKATLKTAQGQWTDDAASATDSARYFQAFPTLGQADTQVLKYDQKFAPGERQTATVVFGFPIAKDQFDQRQSLSVTIQPFDNLPVTFAK